MKISIIIPAYNEEKNLPKIIRSLRNENSKEVEIIVVDNNSTDNTLKVAKKLADKVYQCKEQGITYARNYGAKKARNNIIAFLDADSTIYPDWINQINETFAKNKNLSVVSGIGIYENKNFLKRLVLNAFSYIIFYYNTLSTFWGNPALIANNFAIKKNVFDKVGGFEHFVVEDYYLTLKLKKLNAKSKMNRKMKVEYSSRRIEKNGLFSVWKVWLVSLLKKIPSGEYTLHDKL